MATPAAQSPLSGRVLPSISKDPSEHPRPGLVVLPRLTDEKGEPQRGQTTRSNSEEWMQALLPAAGLSAFEKVSHRGAATGPVTAAHPPGSSLGGRE